RLTVLAALLVAAGCGRSTGTVSGKVTFKNQPLKGGTVTFTPKDGPGFVIAQIQPDGSYTAENVPVGETAVTVETETVAPRKMPKGVINTKGIKNAEGEAVETPYSYERSGDNYVKIPPGYSNPSKSGLQLTVTSGSQTYDPPLK